MEQANSKPEKQKRMLPFVLPSSKTVAIVPLRQAPPYKIQQYWLTLQMHDLLAPRLADVIDPTWDIVKEMIVRMGDRMFMCFDIVRGEFVGEFMLENFTGKAAQIHFSVHPDNSFRYSIMLGQLVIRTILDTWKVKDDASLPYLDTLYGLTPVDNRTACIYVLKAGMKKMCILKSAIKNQGKIVDAMVTAVTRS